MATLRCLLFLLLLLLMACSAHARARDFFVGGAGGWVPNPCESYNTWAGRNRFQIHDKLVFKYKKGDDLVLQVSHEDYLKCNISNPVRTMGSGDSWLTLQRTGPFFFISGVPGHCDKGGQKMIVVVLAKRHDGVVPLSPSPSPSPSTCLPPPPAHSASQMPPSPSKPQPTSTPPSPDAPDSSASAQSPGPSPSTSGSEVLAAPMAMIMLMALTLGGSAVGFS